ncbi:type IV conjugative transfer system protein TraE [Rickettsiales endosymbiont of Trichoplax sp. H2]|uniref:type IV conjugative transfer system protein TraE n=1 Tax=Rickettsiales endosymbiont of Trichoplax sp. H2 TaxID=2021221 RepID=UPI0012B1DF26|nr:type IV conjugative transfer system protein TraE [Rickettsiales endosymbiont of Trichoplax sp. H2]MSO14457.1 hypothetical protein [Rickettsiales endosymbiont of Trichoplax sp. H2]
MEAVYQKKVTNKYYNQRNVAVIVCIVLLVANVLLSLSVLKAREKTVIIPAYLKQSVWVQGELMSSSYLEEMARYFSELLLDVTADNSKYKRDIVLRYVSPEYHNILENELIKEEKKLRKYNLTTDYVVKKIIVDEQNLQAKVIGTLIKYVAGQRVSEKEEKVTIRFGYASGIMLVKEFKRENKKE